MRGKQSLAADRLCVGTLGASQEPRRNNEAATSDHLPASVEEIGQQFRVGVIVAALVFNRLDVQL